MKARDRKMMKLFVSLWCLVHLVSAAVNAGSGKVQQEK
jgi:hypothetical protein